jgi:hypothetical protein
VDGVLFTGVAFIDEASAASKPAYRTLKRASGYDADAMEWLIIAD